jgi:hypothetical protein
MDDSTSSNAASRRARVDPITGAVIRGALESIAIENMPQADADELLQHNS